MSEFRHLFLEVWCLISDVWFLNSGICNLSDVWFLISDICYQTFDFIIHTSVFRRLFFVIRCLISNFRHLLSDVWFLMLDICYQMFDIWIQTSVIRHLISNVRHLLSDVWFLNWDICLISNVRHLLSDVWCLRSNIWFLMSDVWFLMSDICYWHFNINRMYRILKRLHKKSIKFYDDLIKVQSLWYLKFSRHDMWKGNSVFHTHRKRDASLTHTRRVLKVIKFSPKVFFSGR